MIDMKFFTGTPSVGWSLSICDIDITLRKYDHKKLSDGYNILHDGEEIFYISNPALGLWAYKERFNN